MLYIVGWGRSGTTILGNILGELPGFVHVGEVRAVWDCALDALRCGCGQPTGDCALWQRVLRRALGSEAVTPEALCARIALRQRVDRTRHLPQLLGLGAATLQPHLDEHLRSLAQLYGAIREVTGAQVIVDSSKMPSHALLLGRLPDVELTLLHLVRDPRATAYAWRKLRPALDSESERLMPRYSAAKTAFHWMVWNALAELAWGRGGHYQLVEYAQFVREPQRVVQQALALLGRGDLPLSPPFTGPQEVELRGNHTVSGNPGRFEQGRVALRLDDAWRTRIAPRDKWVVNLMTWPLLLRYGYLGGR